MYSKQVQLFSTQNPKRNESRPISSHARSNEHGEEFRRKGENSKSSLKSSLPQENSKTESSLPQTSTCPTPRVNANTTSNSTQQQSNEKKLRQQKKARRIPRGAPRCSRMAQENKVPSSAFVNFANPKLEETLTERCAIYRSAQHRKLNSVSSRQTVYVSRHRERKFRVVHTKNHSFNSCPCSSMFVDSAKEEGGGRSTDPSCDDPYPRSQNPNNPYTELSKAVQEELRRRYCGENSSLTKATPSEGATNDDPALTDRTGGGEPDQEGETNAETRERARGEEEQEYDEDEDEVGAPQAVREVGPRREPQSSCELMSYFHKTKMEDVCKEVRPAKLLSHLKDAGYFCHNYSNHTRTTTDNYNLKNGNKKGVERLYTLLAIY